MRPEPLGFLILGGPAAPSESPCTHPLTHSLTLQLLLLLTGKWAGRMQRALATRAVGWPAARVWAPECPKLRGRMERLMVKARDSGQAAWVQILALP